MQSKLAYLGSPDAPTAAPRQDGPVLSIVIISYRRHEELLHCLDDLARQVAAAPFEVVLVLQAYPAGVPERIEGEYASRLPLRVVAFDRGLGVHGARNAALPIVTGRIVAFLDDDVRLEPDWIETLIPFYDDPTVGGVGGYVEHPGCRSVAGRFVRPMLGLSSRRYRIDWGGFNTIPWSSHPAADQPADWLSGCNMSFRREALERVGGFDVSYGNYGFDDVDMGLRVRREGWRLVSSRRLAVRHFPSTINRPSFPDLVREEEARRVMLVRKAIGHLPLWRARYALRFGFQLVALFTQGLQRGCARRVVASALVGARTGLQRHGSTGEPLSGARVPVQR
jgi:GT2 family glycosyltransferase